MAVPHEIDAAFQRALARRPEARFQTARDLADALEAAAQSTSGSPSGARATLLMTAPPSPSDTVTSAPAARVAADDDLAHAQEAAERRPIPVGATPSTTRSHASQKRRVPATALALVLGILVGGGMLFAWHTKTRKATSTGTSIIRLAVLPFENIGDTSDAYFADGITEAVRGKLTSLPGIEVIGSASSGQYRKTTKSSEEIGAELQAQYLLTGRVRWAKESAGSSRVQVSSELVEASTASDKWAQPFDAPLTDVFQVQADIASRVAHELQIALTPAVKRTLGLPPTNNLAAYDAYLRGKEFQKQGELLWTLQRAAAEYQKAIALDSTFSLAWTALSHVLALQFGNGLRTPMLTDSIDRVSAHALALAPNLAEANAARSLYFALVRNDPARALVQLKDVLAREPGNVRSIRGAAFAKQHLGRWDDAIADYQRAVRLDPQSYKAFEQLGAAELLTRHYRAARADLDRALELQPDNISNVERRAMVSLLLGDLAGARAVARQAPTSVDRATLVAYFGDASDLGWMLDSADENRLLKLTADAFEGGEAMRSLIVAQQYRFRRDRIHMRAHADTARLAIERQIQIAPNDALLHSQLGLVLAYLNRKSDAIGEGKRALSLPATVGSDTLYFQHQLARIYIEVGEPEKALDLLEPLLRAPYELSPAWLKIDPNFDALHGNPRFERLVAGAERDG